MVALGPAGPGRLVDVVTTAAKAGKGTPDILEIEAAEAMAQRFSILESVDIPAGAIGTSPLRPEGHPAHQASTDVASLPLESSDDASPAILNYVKRTRASLVIDNAVLEPSLVSDPYIIQYRPKSIVCLPVISQANLVGILYLENNLTTHAFTPLRLALLHVLASQMAMAWENARLYTAMVREIAEHRRTEEALQKALIEVAQLKDQLQAENVYLQQEIQSVHTFVEIIGRSQPLLEVLHQVEQVAPTEATVLILNVLERAMILSLGSTLTLHDVLEITPSPALPATPAHSRKGVEHVHILAVLDACQWRIKGDGHAAARLGLPPSTLRSRMKKLGITRRR
jgi:GAF domain-containing protein